MTNSDEVNPNLFYGRLRSYEYAQLAWDQKLVGID
jgi:hypothetical protein